MQACLPSPRLHCFLFCIMHFIDFSVTIIFFNKPFKNNTASLLVMAPSVLFLSTGCLRSGNKNTMQFYSSPTASLFSSCLFLFIFPVILCVKILGGAMNLLFFSFYWVEDQLRKNIGNSPMEIKMSAFTSDKTCCWVWSLPLRDCSGGRQAYAWRP